MVYCINGTEKLAKLVNEFIKKTLVHSNKIENELEDNVFCTKFNRDTFPLGWLGRGDLSGWASTIDVDISDSNVCPFTAVYLPQDKLKRIKTIIKTYRPIDIDFTTTPNRITKYPFVSGEFPEAEFLPYSEPLNSERFTNIALTYSKVVRFFDNRFNPIGKGKETLLHDAHKYSFNKILLEEVLKADKFLNLLEEVRNAEALDYLIKKG